METNEETNAENGTFTSHDGHDPPPYWFLLLCRTEENSLILSSNDEENKLDAMADTQAVNHHQSRNLNNKGRLFDEIRKLFVPLETSPLHDLLYCNLLSGSPKAVSTHNKQLGTSPIKDSCYGARGKKVTLCSQLQWRKDMLLDSDVDEGPNAAVAFMANLSSTSATNSQVNEVYSNDNPIFDNVDYQLSQEMHQDEHLDSDAETKIDDNTIPYHQYLLDTEA
ncbi:hypothetical protein Tco_1326619 [Tanacetum coccineum]